MAYLTSPLTGIEVRIASFFIENVSEQFAIREIARQTKIDYKRTHSAIQKLVKKGVLTKKRQANIDLCSLNLRGDLTTCYYVEMLRAKYFLDKHTELKSFFQSIKEKVKTTYYSLVVFGSFAKGKETTTSDVDLLIVAPNRPVGEEIERIITSEGLLLGRKVQPIVLDEKEFVENLASKKLNVIVEAFKNHIIITGVEGFYNGVKQTI